MPFLLASWGKGKALPYLHECEVRVLATASSCQEHTFTQHFIHVILDFMHSVSSKAWCYTLLIPALGKQKQTDFCEFKSWLVYIVNSKPAKAT